MGNYDDIGLPIQGQPISSGNFGIKVRDAVIDLDRRLSTLDPEDNTGKASTTSTLVLSTTTVTTALTVTDMVFRANTAYEAVMRTGVVSGVSGTLVNMRLQKWDAVPANGANFGEYFRFEGKGAPVMSALGTIYLYNATDDDIVTDVNLTAASSVAAASAITLYANTNSPRFLTIKPAGAASAYLNLGVQVS